MLYISILSTVVLSSAAGTLVLSEVNISIHNIIDASLDSLKKLEVPVSSSSLCDGIITSELESATSWTCFLFYVKRQL